MILPNTTREKANMKTVANPRKNVQVRVQHEERRNENFVEEINRETRFCVTKSRYSQLGLADKLSYY